MNWIVDAIKPLGIVVDEKFVLMIESMDPRLKVPSRFTIARDVEKLYETGNKSTKEVKNVDLKIAYNLFKRWLIKVELILDQLKQQNCLFI